MAKANAYTAALDELSRYCTKHRLIGTPIWEIDDSDIFRKLYEKAHSNRLSWLLKSIVTGQLKSAVPLYVQFLKENRSADIKEVHTDPREKPIDADNTVNAGMHQADTSGDQNNKETGVSQQLADTAAISEENEKEDLMDNADDGSQSIIKGEQDSNPSSLNMTVKDKEGGEPIAPEQTNAHAAPGTEGSFLNTEDQDPILQLLDDLKIKYVDMRPKQRRLWIVGGISMSRQVNELNNMGYHFLFVSGGSKSTKWQDAWFLSKVDAAAKHGPAPAQEDKASGSNAAASLQSVADRPSPDEKPEITLDPDLLKIVNDEDMHLLRDTLISDGILTLEQFRKENPWAYMNRHRMYTLAQRQAINNRILKKLSAEEDDDSQGQYSLETKNLVYTGGSPAKALAHYCDGMAQIYPLKMRNLVNMLYLKKGTIVLHREPPSEIAVKVTALNAFVAGGLTADGALLYAQWIARMCGSNDTPLRLKEPSESQQNVNNLTANMPITEKTEEHAETVKPPYVPTLIVGGSLRPDEPKEPPAKVEVQPRGDGYRPPTAVEVPPARSESQLSKAEKIVLDADLDGITIQDLSAKLQTTMTAARAITDKSNHIILLGNKYYHDEAFVDWEEGADKLESILDRLMAKSDGYVTASRLYEYARSEMQIFLNDNDLDDPQLIYDMARFLFEKQKRHGKEYSFRAGMHISKVGKTIDTFHDLVCSYAENHDGFVRENELAEYFVSLGLKPNNLRNHMRLYSDPIFFYYDMDHDTSSFLYAKSMHMDEEWFASVRTALRKLFDDMGDHVILRDIQPWWFSQLPGLPGGRPWTTLLLQSIVQFYSKELDGVHTISALTGQASNTIHAMIVSKDSEVQNFADAVAAFLIDDGIEERAFEAEELRQMLVRRGMVAGNELIWNMHKALADDSRFIWDAEGRYVNVKV